MEEYGIEDGLRDLTLREVAEDGTHHLWAGSESGLVVSEKPLDAYEPGKRVKFVNAIGNEPLPQMRIRRNCLVTGIDGWVWAGVQDVLVRYRFHGDALERGAIDTLPMTARHLEHADAARRLGARGAELRSDSAVRSRRNVSRAAARAAARASTRALMEERNGALWGGCTNGAVWRGQGDRYEIVNHDLTERIVSIIETSRDELWVGQPRLGRGAPRRKQSRRPPRRQSRRAISSATRSGRCSRIAKAISGSRRTAACRGCARTTAPSRR